MVQLIAQAGPVRNFAVLIVDGSIKDTQDNEAVHPGYWIDRFCGTISMFLLSISLTIGNYRVVQSTRNVIGTKEWCGTDN